MREILFRGKRVDNGEIKFTRDEHEGRKRIGCI